MKTPNVSPQMSAAVERFESCLEEPVVPGELPEWAANAYAACEAVAPHLRHEIDQVHPKLFREIQQEDPSLGTRIEELRQADTELTQRLSDVDHALSELRSAASIAEPDESRIEAQLDAAVKSGLDFVIALRKQETAIATWYVEAFQRDRGVAD